jgi:stress response protein YsnF
MKVAQLDVDIKGGERITVAAEEVQIDRGRREVRIQGYAPGAYQTAMAADRTSSRTDDRLTRTEEELRVGTRAVEAGEVVVGKHVETEHKQVPVNLKREKL